MPFIKWVQTKLFGDHESTKTSYVPIRTRDELRQLRWDDERTNSETVEIVYLTMSTVQQKLVEILRSTNNKNVQVFETEQTFIDRISVEPDRKVLLVVDGPPSSSLLNSLKSLLQVDSLLVYSTLTNTSDAYEPMTANSMSDWCRNEGDLVNAIRRSYKEFDQLAATISWYNQRQKTARDLTKASGSFLFFQLFKTVLKSMPKTPAAKQSMITACRANYQGNAKELANIDKFDSTYKSSEAIQWYTKDTFLYKLINKALRTESIEMLYLFHFYIVDLCDQLEIKCGQLRRKQTEILQLYRGITMSRDEVENFQNNLGNLISPNGYLSTSRLDSVALDFARRSILRQDAVRVLFEYQIDLNLVKTIVVADISQYSEYPKEAEMLVDLGATFEIKSVVYDEHNELWKITMNATDKGANLAKEYMDYQKQKTAQASVVLMFSQLLLDMGEYTKAENYLDSIIRSTNPSDEERAGIYFNFGRAHCLEGDFSKAANYYNEAFDLHMQARPKRLYSAANTLNGIGVVHSEQNNYQAAEDCFKRALELLNKSVPSTHTNVAVVLINLGTVQCNRQQYDEGLKSFLKAQKIYQRILPSEHFSIAVPLVNIGNIYLKRGDLGKALDNFNAALEVQQKSLPNDHPDIVRTLHNLAMVYKRQGNDERACQYFQQAEDIASRTLPSEHPILCTLDANRSHVFDMLMVA